MTNINNTIVLYGSGDESQNFVSKLRDKITMHIDQNTGKIGEPEVKAGGPGSGRKSSGAKGLNKWKSPEEERKAAAKDPKQLQLKLKAAQEEDTDEMEGIPNTPGTNKSITQVGTQFCVTSDGIDKNLGCWPSKRKASDVAQGKSFIESDLDDPGDVDAGIPKIKIPSIPSVHIKNRNIKPLSHKPNPSMKDGVGVKHNFPNPSMPIRAFADMGEPMAGALQHAHMDVNQFFHPPSLRNPDRIPVDDPKETNNRFLDVTKRKERQKDRMKILKRGAPGGTPPEIPARTTLVAPHTAAYQPGMFASKIKPRKNLNEAVTRVSYVNRGRI